MSRIAKVATLGLGTSALVLSGAGLASAAADANGVAVNSPGVVSGNEIQAPVHVPVNLCGTTVSALFSLMNPSSGNACGNADGQ
ncbi:chaplin [Streptomyces sp. NPDC048304]|uniref:chaplin n=1 Tax=Streptomyces sp. NPDC048304 TaxID=3154820 RepID=UPI0033CC82AE